MMYGAVTYGDFDKYHIKPLSPREIVGALLKIKK
jgi:hypothetical protein